MVDTISSLIFPAPKPSYSFAKQYRDGRLVHIRRRDSSHSFTVGYYYSLTLLHPSLAKELEEVTLLPSEARNDNLNSKNNSEESFETENFVTSAYYDGNKTGSVPLVWPNVSLIDDKLNISTRPPPSHLIIYAHPNACDIDMLSEDLSYIGLQYCNVDVLAWEFRGYGMCKDYGAPSEIELYRDMEGVYTFATEELKIPPSRIILMGRSIGTGPVVQLAAYIDKQLELQRDVNGNQEKIAGVFLQCPFTSISDSVDSIISNRTSSFSFGGDIAAKVTKSIARKVLVDRFRSIDVIPRIFGFQGAKDTTGTAPLCDTVRRLIIHHGEQDSIVPISHSEKLIEVIRASIITSLTLSSDKRIAPSTAEIAATMDSITHLEVERNCGHNDLSSFIAAELIEDHFVAPFLARNQSDNSNENPLVTAVMKYLPAYIMGNSFYLEVYRQKVIKRTFTRDIKKRNKNISKGKASGGKGDSNNNNNNNASYDNKQTENTQRDDDEVVQSDTLPLLRDHEANSEVHRIIRQDSITTRDFGTWARIALPRSLHDFGHILWSIAATPNDTPMAYRARRGLSKVLTASVCCFTQHVAMDWLRTQRKRAILEKELKTRSCGSSASSFISTQGIMGTLQACSDVSGSTTSAMKRLMSSISAKEFILEQILMHGSPLGIYLLPVIRGRDSDQISGIPQEKPTTRNNNDDEKSHEKIDTFNNNDYDYLRNDSRPSAGCHALVFGSFAADPCSIGRSSKQSGTITPTTPTPSPLTKPSLVNKNTTYQCCYTSYVGLSPAPAPQTQTKGEVTKTITFTSSSKKMKRLPHRLPKVPLFEIEMSENLIHVVENFLLSLSDSALGGIGQPLNDFDVDDLCGTVAIENTILAMTEQQVDIIQSECERILIALQHQECGLHMGTLGYVRGPFTGSNAPLIKVLRPVLRLLCGISEYEEEEEKQQKQNELQQSVISTSMAITTNNNNNSGGEMDNNNNTREDNCKKINNKINNNNNTVSDGYVISELYQPSSFTRESGIIIPIPLLEKLSKGFSYDFFNTTGDLSSVCINVQERARYITELTSKEKKVNNNSSNKNKNKNKKNKNKIDKKKKVSSDNTTVEGELSQIDSPSSPEVDNNITNNNNNIAQTIDTYASLIFDLQSVLLRNIPEGLVGAVGCGRYPESDAAVSLIYIIYNQGVIPSGLFFNMNRIRTVDNNNNNINNNNNGISSDEYRYSFNGGYGGTFIPALVGGCGQTSNNNNINNNINNNNKKNRICEQYRGDKNRVIYSPDEGILQWIRPDISVSAGSADNQDCVIS